MASRKPAILRMTGTNGSGPTASPIWRCPSCTRWLERELHRGDVVVGDERGVDALDVAVDQDDRQPALAQARVAVGVGRGVGVLAGDVDDPGDAAVEQHLHVVVLVHPARRLGAQHRRVAVPGQRGLDDLGERREDRVGQLGHDQPDQAGALAPQPARPVVAEHVQRR